MQWWNSYLPCNEKKLIIFATLSNCAYIWLGLCGCRCRYECRYGCKCGIGCKCGYKCGYWYRYTGMRAGICTSAFIHPQNTRTLTKIPGNELTVHLKCFLQWTGKRRRRRRRRERWGDHSTKVLHFHLWMSHMRNKKKNIHIKNIVINICT